VDDDFILDTLVMLGIVTDEQAEEVREAAYELELADDDEGPDGVIRCLEDRQLTSEDEVIQLVANEYGMESFDLSDYRISEDVIKLLKPEVAKRFKVVPIMKYDNNLTIGIHDPTDIESLDAIRYILKMDIDAVVCKKRDLVKTIDKYYGTTDEAVDSFLAEVTAGDVEITGVVASADDGADEEADDAPIIRLVSLIIIEAYRGRASDIHLEPMEKRFRVRYRIDGMLNEMENPPKYLQNNIIQRLKIMARLDITEKRVPQDGRIQFRFPGKDLDLRVSTVPTVHGESIVMRILDKSSIQLGIPELGFFADDQQMIEEIIAMPDGIFLVTGPTGSGKTTSLYAFLNTINTPNRKIITAEDPVEYELAGINQVQCDKSIGMTFGYALRAMLRQAPNIIMVGEIRDIETGAIAINAALTGHLVFSTLHTNDAPGAVTRMIDMGVKPFLVASAVKAIMAQRLVRRLCKNCTVPTTADPNELHLLELPEDYFDGAELKRGEGCTECSGGYKGRGGVYEIFMVDEHIIPMIFDSAPADEIKQRARELGMRTLRDDALRKAGAGMTTLEEVIRVTKSDEEEEG
jgi:general secretion pathway protein E/type IV pilus assembly protein PilB